MFWKKKNRIEGNIASKVTYLLNFKERYQSKFEDVSIPLSNRVLSELFLFRAWTTQWAYRVFAHEKSHDDLITETLSSAGSVGLVFFQKTLGFSIEHELGDEFIELVEDRFFKYDKIIVQNPSIPPFEYGPLLQIELVSICGISPKGDEVNLYVSLLEEWLDHVNQIVLNCSEFNAFAS